MSIRLLTNLFHFGNDGCSTCKAKFEDFSFTTLGAVIKGKFQCKNKHIWHWSSSESLGMLCRDLLLIFLLLDPNNKTSEFVVNARIPAAAAMNGIRQPSLISFLSLLHVDCYGQQYMKGNSLNSR